MHLYCDRLVRIVYNAIQFYKLDLTVFKNVVKNNTRKL